MRKTGDLFVILPSQSHKVRESQKWHEKMLSPQEGTSKFRNPQIARIFYLCNYVERAGSGIPRMKDEMKKAGLPAPDFTKSGTERFKVILLRPGSKPEQAPKPLFSTIRRAINRKQRYLLISLVLTTTLLASFQIASRFSSNPSLAAATATSSAAIAACRAAPMLVAPVDGQTLNSRTVTMTWEAPLGCLPDGYTVRISANYDPEAKPWIVDTGWGPTFYQYTFSTDGIYYWHIRACKPCTPFNPGIWVIRSFIILTSSTP